MAQVASVDYDLKRIYAHSDTVVGGFDIIAAYFEINVLREANAGGEQNRAHMLSAEGNIPKGGGNFTPRYGLLQPGWRIVPYDQVSHVFQLTTEPVSLDGLAGRDCVDRTGILVNIDVDETYEKIEIRTVNTGSGLDATQDANLTSIAAKAAQMVFTNANQLDVNVQSMNDAEVQGDGTDGNAWRGVGVPP